MRTLRIVLAVGIGLVLAAPAQAQAPSCTATGQSVFVRNTLQELYLWYPRTARRRPGALCHAGGVPRGRALPAARPRRSATSPPAPPTTPSTRTASSSASACRRRSKAGQLRVLQVFAGSPAEEAGLERGAAITAIDGQAVSALIDGGGLDTAFGPAQVGIDVTIEFVTPEWRPPQRGRAQTRRDHPHGIAHVPSSRWSGRQVGYLFFRNFVRPVGGGPRRGVRDPARSRRARARARPALQRRRARRCGRRIWPA